MKLETENSIKNGGGNQLEQNLVNNVCCYLLVETTDKHEKVYCLEMIYVSKMKCQPSLHDSCERFKNWGRCSKSAGGFKR